jgi:hypothetical protein
MIGLSDITSPSRASSRKQLHWHWSDGGGTAGLYHLFIMIQPPAWLGRSPSLWLYDLS